MWWIVGVVSFVLVLVGGAAAWFIAPTLRTFRGPDFQPSPTDDVSVLLAQQSSVIDTGA
jgi:hypothetical protein